MDNIKNVTFKKNTILLMVGPSCCGKSYFCENVLKTQLENFNIEYVSSDDIRRDFLGNNEIHKHDKKMMQVSKQAFDMLYTRIRLNATYPVNKDLIIVDTTGLSEFFRKDIKNIAKDTNYNLSAVVFNYKDREDYYKYLDDKSSRKVVSEHIKKLKRETFQNLNKKDYDQIIRVQNTNFNDFIFTIDTKDYNDCVLPDENCDYTIIGDVHECVDELKELLEKNGFQHNQEGELDDGFSDYIVDNIGNENKKSNFIHKRAILVGDWIDKGKQTKEIIDYLYLNKDSGLIKLVLGNHENFVYKFLKGQIKVYLDFFDSVPFLQENEEYRKKFFTLVEMAKPFYKTSKFIVTHTPCKNKYLEKTNRGGISKQCRMRYPFRRDFENEEEFNEEYDETLKHLKSDSNGIYPYHIFGHIQVERPWKLSNKLGIDAACVSGNELSSVTLGVSNHKPYFQFVKSRKNYSNYKEKLLKGILRFEKKKFDIESLERNERNRINWIIKNKVNFISGTMSPPEVLEDKLECMESALNYYRDSGVKYVTLQPKYMGSRCNAYIFEDIDKCYLTTRNGFRIKPERFGEERLKDVLEKLQGEHLKWMKEQNLKMVILDGELLPWFALGEGLIEKSFKTVEKALETECQILEDSGFYTQLNNGFKEYTDSGFIHDVGLGGKELKKKYGHKYQTFNALQHFKPMSNEEERNCLEVFKKQIQLYGQDSECEVKCFSILKTIDNEGKEEIPCFTNTNGSMYNTVNKEGKCLRLDLEDSNAIEKAEEFFAEITTVENMEGLVVKPDEITEKSKNTVPYLKVRNPDYLTIVYGYNYQIPHKMKKLLKEKKVSTKMRVSKSEWNLGIEMLKTPHDSITEDNEEYKQLVARMILEEHKERDLDLRL